MHTSTFLATALAATLALGTANAASVTDGMFFNTSGPGVTNSTVPAPRNAFGGDHPPAIVARNSAPAPATSAVDASVFNTSGPGAVASLNPTGVPATGYGETVPDVPRTANLAATQPVDPTLYNTAGAGALAALNPNLHRGTLPSVHYAQLKLGH